MRWTRPKEWQNCPYAACMPVPTCICLSTLRMSLRQFLEQACHLNPSSQGFHLVDAPCLMQSKSLSAFCIGSHECLQGKAGSTFQDHWAFHYCLAREGFPIEYKSHESFNSHCWQVASHKATLPKATRFIQGCHHSHQKWPFIISNDALTRLDQIPSRVIYSSPRSCLSSLAIRAIKTDTNGFYFCVRIQNAEWTYGGAIASVVWMPLII